MDKKETKEQRMQRNFRRHAENARIIVRVTTGSLELRTKLLSFVDTYLTESQTKAQKGAK